MTADFSFTTLGSTSIAAATAVGRGVAGAVNLVGGPAVKLLGAVPIAIRAHFNRGDVLRMLDMDDRMLRDIGLTRGDVTSALSGPLVSDPSTRLRIFAVERRAASRAQAREQLLEARQLQEAEQLTRRLTTACSPQNVV
jgi:uncharacterized protein YjiS (DUF1127 family)